MKTSVSALSRFGLKSKPPPISWLMNLALDRPKLISLAAGFTDSESLPVDHTRDLLNRILRPGSRDGRVALQYGSPQGHTGLRQLTAARCRRLDRARGSNRAYSPERLIVTNGSQQLLYMVTEALCDEGDLVLVEDPTYFVYMGIVEARGLKARAVRMESDGLSLEHLESTLRSLERSGGLKRLKLLYLVSYFQNPTGITTSREKKSAILRLLRRFERSAGHAIYLLEDAAYRELRFRGPNVASALAMRGGAERVICAGTYSKPFATGARVGFGFLPEPVFTAVMGIKGNHDFGTSNLLQELMAQALASGRYAVHVRRLQRVYARKAACMQRSLKAHFPPGASWIAPEGGLYCWVKLPGNTSTGRGSKLFRAALAENVLYVPGELCYADDATRRKPANELRLSFGNVTETEIAAGIRRLGSALGRL